MLYFRTTIEHRYEGEFIQLKAPIHHVANVDRKDHC